MSRPMRTLSVPSLASDESQLNRKPNGVLLLVAGTGIVAVPQVLHHTDSSTCFRSGGTPPLKNARVRVVYCCRSDDALMIGELANWCRDEALKHCVVFLTESSPSPDDSPPFPNAVGTDVTAAFAGLENASCTSGRLSIEVLQTELEAIESPVGKPRRIVVSGPAGFNKAAKQMLDQCDVEAEAVTILEA